VPVKYRGWLVCVDEQLNDDDVAQPVKRTVSRQLAYIWELLLRWLYGDTRWIRLTIVYFAITYSVHLPISLITIQTRETGVSHDL